MGPKTRRCENVRQGGPLTTISADILRPRENPKIDWRVDPDINGISEVRSFRVLTWTEYSWLGASISGIPKKHFEVAAQAGVARIVGVKDNQPTLHQRIQEVSATTTAIGSAHSHDKGRNRDERRTVTVLDPADTLADTGWHPHVAAIIRVERRVYIRNAKTGLLRHSAETAFYVANTPVTAARAAEAIRAHWKIENTSHYTRDVTLGEDRSRIRTNPGVFARLRSFAFNILKANRTDTLSQDRYRAGLAGIKQLLSLTAIRKR